MIIGIRKHDVHIKYIFIVLTEPPNVLITDIQLNYGEILSN